MYGRIWFDIVKNVGATWIFLLKSLKMSTFSWSLKYCYLPKFVTLRNAKWRFSCILQYQTVRVILNMPWLHLAFIKSQTEKKSWSFKICPDSKVDNFTVFVPFVTFHCNSYIQIYLRHENDARFINRCEFVILLGWNNF